MNHLFRKEIEIKPKKGLLRDGEGDDTDNDC